MTTTVDRVRELIAPLVADADLDLYDLDMAGGVLSVLVDAPGGADIDAISRLARTISRTLDEQDPIQGSYALEVGSPGLERTLRTPAHFVKAIGETVAVKVARAAAEEGDRRIRGVLVAAGDDTVTIRDEASQSDRTLHHGDIQRARTVFEWGPTNQAKPNQPKTQKATVR